MESSAEVWLENAAQGQRSRVVELPGKTGGRRLVIEYVNQPRRGETAVPAHIHTTFHETFHILRGQAKYRLGGAIGVARAGDVVEMPRLVPHVHPWSDSDEELHVLQTVIADPPDLRGMVNSLQGAVTIQGLAKEGRVNARGVPGLLQTAVIIDAAMPATCLAGVPIPIQRVAFGVLARIGRLRGYRTGYERYGLVTPDTLRLPA